MLPVSLVIPSEVLSGATCVTVCLVLSKDRGNGGSDETVWGPTSESDQLGNTGGDCFSPQSCNFFLLASGNSTCLEWLAVEVWIENCVKA